MTTSTAMMKTEPAWLIAARQARWTPEVAAQVVRAWEEEGGTQAGFLRKYGLPRGRLRFWTKVREGRKEVRPALAFVPVEVRRGAEQEAMGVEGKEVVVEMGGVRVKVEAGASQGLVEQVLRAVKEVQGC
jgi:transposase